MMKVMANGKKFVISGLLMVGLVTAAPPAAYSDGQHPHATEQGNHAGGHGHGHEGGKHEEANVHSHDGGSGHGHERDHGARVPEPDLVVLAEDELELAGIRVETVAAETIEKIIRAAGEVVYNGYETRLVTPRTAVQVSERRVVLGERVSRGQPLATLVSVEMAGLQIELESVGREWLRIRERGRAAVGNQRYDKARADFEQVRARALSYGLSEAQLEHWLQDPDAEPRRGEFELLAPRDGLVQTDDFVVGEWIEPGRVLFTLVDDGSVWVNARIPAAVTAAIPLGSQARVVLAETELTGVVQQAAVIDPKTRTRLFRLQLPGPVLWPYLGRFVEVELRVGADEPMIRLPETALTGNDAQGWSVFVAEADNRFRRIPVDPRQTVAGGRVIAGLRPGTSVVTEGALFLASELAKGGFDPHQH